MPKVRNRDPDYKHKLEIKKWIADGNIEQGIELPELSRRTGIACSTLYYRIKHPETLRKCEEWAIARVIGEIQPLN